MSINKDIADAGLSQRAGLIVYLKNASDQYKLRHFGDIVYFSKKMRYCMLYIDLNDLDYELSEISELDFVDHVEISEKDQLNLDSKHIEKQLVEMSEKAEVELQKRQKENEDILK